MNYELRTFIDVKNKIMSRFIAITNYELMNEMSTETVCGLCQVRRRSHSEGKQLRIFKELKKYGLYFGLLFTVLLISCGKDDNKVDPYLENWKQQNEKAFNDLAFNPDYIELRMDGRSESIYYRVIQKGNGKRIFYNSRAEIYYKGWFVVTNEEYNILAGTVFTQKLFDDGMPFKYALIASAVDENRTYSTRSEEGWRIALQYMVEGDKWEIWIPYYLGYGEENTNIGIPGYSTLAYEIELVKAIDPDEFEWSTSSIY